MLVYTGAKAAFRNILGLVVLKWMVSENERERGQTERERERERER